MKIIFSFLFLAGALFFTACDHTGCDPDPSPCIDESKKCITCLCTTDYEPVCGCDGQTYTNSCNADVAGVTSYTKGACGGGN